MKIPESAANIQKPILRISEERQLNSQKRITARPHNCPSSARTCAPPQQAVLTRRTIAVGPQGAGGRTALPAGLGLGPTS